MNLWRSISGTVRVELTSAEPEKLLQAINSQGIELWELTFVNELTCCFELGRKSCNAVRRLAEKRGARFRILSYRGLFWKGRQVLHHPVLLAGMLLVLGLSVFLPTRVLFIRVEGNQQVPEKQILAAAEESGIRFGANRREVRSEKVKNAILSAIPQLQWTGVNTSGCVATISVRERAEKEPEEEVHGVSHILASRDGYILTATATRGQLQTAAGQTVQQGQVLVSGITDCGICIQATRAEGEIFALTRRELEAVTPASCLERGAVDAVKRNYSLLIGKKRINLWKGSSISTGSCGRMYKEYYVTLPGGFRLPIALCAEEILFYQESSQPVLEANAQAALGGFSREYVKSQMVAGQIRRESLDVQQEDGCYVLRGSYICAEMIGKEQQIGDTNGENS